MILELKHARRLLADSWIGPTWERRLGTEPWWHPPSDKVTVVGALERCGAARAWPLLESIATPAWARLVELCGSPPATVTPAALREAAQGAMREGDLFEWLEQGYRAKADVLDLFTEAIKRSKKLTQKGERR